MRITTPPIPQCFETVHKETERLLNPKLESQEVALAHKALAQNLRFIEQHLKQKSLREKISQSPQQKDFLLRLDKVSNIKGDQKELLSSKETAKKCHDLISIVVQPTEKKTGPLQKAKETIQKFGQKVETKIEAEVKERIGKAVKEEPSQKFKKVVQEIKIPKEAIQTLDTTIEALEENLSSRKRSCLSSQRLVFAMRSYLVFNIAHIDQVLLEHRPFCLAPLFDDITAEKPSLNCIGLLVTSLLQDHQEFVDKLLYSHILKALNNFYSTFESAGNEHPNLLPELLDKAFRAMHAHKEGKSIPSQEKKPTEETIASMLGGVALPIFFPNGIEEAVDDLINLKLFEALPGVSSLLPDTFKKLPDLPGKEGLKKKIEKKLETEICEKTKEALPKLPLLAGKGIVKIANDKEMQQRMLVVIYRKVSQALTTLSEEKLKPTKNRKELPPEIKKSLTESIALTLNDVASGSDRTSRFVRTFSPQIAEQLTKVVENAANISSVDMAEEIFCLSTEPVQKYLLRRANEKKPRLPRKEKLDRFNKEIASKIQDLFEIVWKQTKTDVEKLSENAIVAIVQKAFHYLQELFTYIALRLFFAIAQPEEFLETKRKETEAFHESFDLEYILETVFGFISEHGKSYLIESERSSTL